MIQEQIRISTGEVDTAISIMRECAEWLVARGQKLWEPADLIRDNILSGITPENIHVAYLNDEPMGTMILQWHDPIFWEQIPPNVSGFVHKLAVRRKFSGQGVAGVLLRHAENECRKNKIDWLRLDCDDDRPKLKQLYASNGFIHAGVKPFRHFTVSLFEKHLGTKL